MKYFIKTFGCQMNVSDSERIINHLEQNGFKQAPTMKGADLIVIVACSVRQSAIDRVWGLLNKIRKLRTKNKKNKIIITGCILSSDKNKFLEFLAPYRTEGSGSGFDEVLTINELLGKNYLELQPKHLNSKLVYVPIMTGCNNFCSYCVVPYTRGREISRPAQNIIREIKKSIKNKCEEIMLLGQNVNSYKNKNINFPKLLKKISETPGKFTIKFLTSHPKDMSDELIDVIADSQKISKEIHLPVQSGDNEILKKMNRGYTAEKYLSLIQKIRKKIPEAKFTTDVIVGFPGETKKQFENTVKLFKKASFAMAYVNKYSARKGTRAANFKDDVLWEEKVRRWKILDKIVNDEASPRLVGLGPKKKRRLIVILGPTASGKSDLAVKIALRLGSGQAEIISADSRQIYRGMDIGTGKITKKEMRGIPHYCLDITTPKKQFSVVEYEEKALEAIDKIYKKSKTPILCGGTGFYIQAVAEGIVVPEVKPDWKLRNELEKKSTEELFLELKKLDPNRAKNIDAKNKRRLIRAIEIIKKTKKPIPDIKKQQQFNVLYVGIKKSTEDLKKLIDKRVDKMIKAGLEGEVKKLVKQYGRTMVLKNTIGYKEWMSAKNKKEAADQIKSNTLKFAKRQMTWFKHNKNINWI